MNEAWCAWCPKRHLGADVCPFMSKSNLRATIAFFSPFFSGSSSRSPPEQQGQLQEAMKLLTQRWIDLGHDGLVPFARVWTEPVH